MEVVGVSRIEVRRYCNHQHHHAGVGRHTPADVHYGHTSATTQHRVAALTAARLATPERFGPTASTPKMLELPTAAWINPPAEPAANPEISAAVAA